MMKLTICILLALSVNLFAQQIDWKKIEIKLELPATAKYSVGNIPILIKIKNNNDRSVRLLCPFDKKGIYLLMFEFLCARTDKKWESTSMLKPQPEKIEDAEQLSYITILKGHEIEIPIMLNEIITPALLPGEYKITMSYKNRLGENCLMGATKAMNELHIIIPEEVEDLPAPEYISKEQAINIALKINKIKYDQSQEISVFLKKGIYTVNLPNKLSKGARGTDFSSKIMIDASTGKVLSIIIGN